jgi:putative oxidoreductase
MGESLRKIFAHFLFIAANKSARRVFIVLIDRCINFPRGKLDAAHLRNLAIGATGRRAQSRTMMHPTLTPLPAIGRILLALIFVLAGISKLGATATTVAHMADHGIPYANDLVWGVIALELGGGIMLIIGLLTRLVAAAFFFYLLALAVIFHAYWTMTGAAAHAQHGDFFQHLAIMGGMLFVVAFGAGPFSIDALIWNRQPLSRQPQPAE